MKNEARKELRKAILDKLNDEMMPLEVGGHTIADQQVYAGCSQWCQDGRQWDETRNAYAYIVDGEYQLTFPDLDYFNGHNQIEKQTAYYIQPDRSESPPDGPVGEPLLKVPDRILLEIAKGLVEAIAQHNQQQETQDQAAEGLVSQLKGSNE